MLILPHLKFGLAGFDYSSIFVLILAYAALTSSSLISNFTIPTDIFKLSLGVFQILFWHSLIEFLAAFHFIVLVVSKIIPH